MDILRAIGARFLTEREKSYPNMKRRRIEGILLYWIVFGCIGGNSWCMSMSKSISMYLHVFNKIEYYKIDIDASMWGYVYIHTFLTSVF